MRRSSLNNIQVLTMMVLVALIGASTTSLKAAASGSAAGTSTAPGVAAPVHPKTSPPILPQGVPAGKPVLVKPPVTPPPRPVSATLDANGNLSLKGEQGLMLHGQYVAGKPKGKGVILLHMNGGSGDDWKALAEKLNRSGYHTLALDLRGHGKSTSLPGGKSLQFAQLDVAQYGLMPADVETAVAWMRQKTTVDPARISLVGASIGANLALKVGAADARIENVVLLSPGLDYKGLLTEAAVEQYGKRPLFIAVSREDSYSSKSSLLLDTSAKGKHFMQIYTGAGHGTKMFAKEPGLSGLIQSWLEGTLEVENDE